MQPRRQVQKVLRKLLVRRKKASQQKEPRRMLEQVPPAAHLLPLSHQNQHRPLLELPVQLQRQRERQQ